MTQVAAGGRAGRRAGGQDNWERGAQGVDSALAKPERYFDRQTAERSSPGGGRGWVSIAPGLLCSNLK